jgi:arylsulfatase A-like enzyme
MEVQFRMLPGHGTSTLFTARRLVPALLAVALLVPAAACPSGRPQRPNVIVILVDALRADYMGVYGFDGPVTPYLDSLARESVLFRNCFTQSPWTKPAVASLFTSLHPQVHGLTNHEGKYWGDATAGLRTGILPAGARTLAEQLREVGYETAAFVANPWLKATYGFDQGFDVYHDEKVDFLATADRLAQDVRAWRDGRDDRRPYFLYLHFMDVHAPYVGSRRDYELLRASQSVRSDETLLPVQMPDRRFHNIEFRPSWATDEMRREVTYWRTRYASSVRTADRRIGEIVEELRETGELGRSLLVFTSDHGEELFEHGDWSHGQNLFDHQLHIPLFIRNPGGRGGGVEVESFIDLIDLMPTLLAAVGAPVPESVQGRDMSALLRGEAVDHPEITFATATQRHPGLYSARTARYKLLYDLDSSWERLFEMVEDGAEWENVGPREPHVADELRDRLLTHIRDSLDEGTLESEQAEIPEDLQERLRALGYLQ